MFVKNIFYSFQGEGPWVGYPQIFLRFYGCNIHCIYCDEPDFEKDKKSVSKESVVNQILELGKKPLHSVSFTGGEPLLQVDAIKALAKELPFKKYLETNGTLPNHLAEVKSLFDYFSVDFKPGFEKEFFEFMLHLKDTPNTYVKYVLMKDFPILEVQSLGKLLKQINPNIPLVLQPVTPFAGVKSKASTEDIQRAYTCATRFLNDVRVIPQTHKFIGLK